MGLDIGNYKNEREVAGSFHDLMHMCARLMSMRIPSVSKF